MNNVSNKIDVFTLNEGDIFYGYSFGLTEIRIVKWIFIKTEYHGSYYGASFICASTKEVIEFYPKNEICCLYRDTSDDERDNLFIFRDEDSAYLYAQQLNYLNVLKNKPLFADDVHQLRNMYNTNN